MQSEHVPPRSNTRPGLERRTRWSHRSTVALAVVLLLSACASVRGSATWPWAHAWQPRALDRTGAAGPARAPVRVTRTDGRQVVLDSALVAGDSIVGRAHRDPARTRSRGPAPAPSAENPPDGTRVAVALSEVAGTDAWQRVAGARRSGGAECHAGRADQPPCRDDRLTALLALGLLFAPILLLALQ